MAVYEIIIGLGALIFGALLWVAFGHYLGDVTDTMSSAIPNSTYVNQTAIDTEIQYTNDIFYFAFFIIAIFVFIWMLKKKGTI